MINPIQQINKSISPYYAPQKNSNYDSTANETLQKAKAILYQSGMNKNLRVINLILMAETALKNGNSIAADDFASRAMQVMNPVDNIKLKGKTISRDHYQKQTDETDKADNTEKKSIKSKDTKHTYKDVSNDAGVSFSYPSSLTGAESFLAVPAHEAQHVGRRVSEAVLKGEQILVSVSYRIRYDPQTGHPYMAGGTTRTIKLTHHSIESASCGTKVDMFA